MLLNENGIRLPKNTKSVKILTHTDADGFFSGLLLFHQLVRQGIKPERIDIKFVQYGDNDLLDNATRKNRFQAVVSSDFSAFPKINMEEKFNSFARTLDKENNKYVYPDKNSGWKAFKAANINKEPSFKLLSDWLKKKAPNCQFFNQKDKGVRMAVSDFMMAWKKYNGDDDVIVTDLDYTSDHHSNVKGNLVPGKAGSIGAENYRSDTEHIAVTSAQNLMNWEDIEIISRIDSATYKNLYDVVRMPEKLTGGDYKERLGIITAALVGSIVKSNKRLAAELIRRSQPSILSVYVNALKIAAINDNELKILSLLKDKEVDWAEVNRLLETLPGAEKKKILQKRDENKNIKPVSKLENMRAKEEKSIAKETDLKTSDFKFYGNVSTWQASNMKLQPSRYMFAFLKHNGITPVFNIRKYPGLGMIQCSVSPFVSSEDKKKIDLEKVCIAAMNEARKKGLVSEFAYDAIMKESGGHKAIYNISGMDIVPNTALKPNERIEARQLRNFEARRKALVNKEAKKALDTKRGRLAELDAVKADAKKKLYDFLEDYIIQELKEKYSDIEAKPTHTFEVK